jgi:cytochrome c biogenesis protein CcdA
MMSLELHLKLAGLAMMVLGVAHVLFGPRFKWKEELERVSLLNRQIFYVHTFFIALVVALLGILAFFYTSALLEPTPLARVLLSGIVIFWGCRLLVQFFVYDASLWKGNRFNTRMHILFALLWLYLVSVFVWALWQQMTIAPQHYQ